MSPNSLAWNIAVSGEKNWVKSGKEETETNF